MTGWCGFWQFSKKAMVLGLLALAGITFMHAWKMTHFVDSGIRTKTIEQHGTREKIVTLFTGVNIPKPTNDKTPADFQLPYSTHHFIGHEGIDLEAWLIPAKRKTQIVILFHGYAAHKSTLLDEALSLNRLGMSVMLVDFYGSGGSAGMKTSIGYHEAEDVRAAVNYAKEKLGSKKIILSGQSMGSAAVMTAVGRDAVVVDGLILIFPFGNLLETVSNRFHMMGLPAFPFAQWLVAWGGLQHGFNGFGHNPESYACNIKIPVLLLYGAGDERVKMDAAQRIYKNLGGPKNLVVFEKAGHESLVKNDPTRWDKTIRAFLGAL